MNVICVNDEEERVNEIQDEIGQHRCSWKNCCLRRVNYRSKRSVNSSFAFLSSNAWFGILSANCVLGMLCLNGFFSLASINAILSIGSINSILSIGSINSVLSIGCKTPSVLKDCGRLTRAPGDIICSSSNNKTETKNSYTFAQDDIAGYTCDGGYYDGYDTNNANNDKNGEKPTITKDLCEENGGKWISYTCGEIESYLHNLKRDQDEQNYYIDTFLKPTCCSYL